MIERVSMRRIPITALRPGMRVARPVYGSSGQVLLQRDVILTRRYVAHLKELGVPFLYIDDGLLDGYRVDDVISDETRAGAVNKVRNLVAAVETPNPAGHVIMRTKDMSRTVNTIVEELLAQQELMVNLIDIRLEDDYLFGHSVNVCVLALVTGITVGLPKEQLVNLGVGAILHDVGKGAIPRNILYKPGSLTKAEYEAVKKHTTEGYEILSTLPHARDVAHEHHERYDGKGYPHGKKGEQIHTNAQIVAICDVYDAVTSTRVYRPAHPAHEALELISGSGNQAFSLKMVTKFLENIAAYPTGSVVELSDKRIGIVIDTPKGFCKYPRIKLLFDEEGRPYSVPVEINTLDFPALVVRRVLTEEEFSQHKGISAN